MRQLAEIVKLSKEYVVSAPHGRPKHEVEEFLAHSLGFSSRVDIYTNFDTPLSEEELYVLRSGIRRLSQGEPLAYILGHVELYGYPFTVSPDVLIPRPETELLIDIAVHAIDMKKTKHVSVLDICTGSGCIGLSLKKERPNIDLTVADISEKALHIAQKNAHNLDLVDVVFELSDLFSSFIGKKQFDIIVANPPYLSQQEWEQSDISLQKYEPSLALIGGKTGTEMYERIVASLKTVLKANDGFFACEIGMNQASAVRSLFEVNSFENIQIYPDIHGFTRVVSCNRQV